MVDSVSLLLNLADKLFFGCAMKKEYIMGCEHVVQIRITQFILLSQIHRLEELRIANLECFTSKIRDEIRGWWDKCYFSDEQRQEFSEIESDEFNGNEFFTQAFIKLSIPRGGIINGEENQRVEKGNRPSK